MELPIRIMITLFVALVVGSTIIMFSKTMIEKSKADIDRTRMGLDPDDLEEEKIIQLNKLDNAQLVDLMVECYNRHHAETFERELCFAVNARTGEWSLTDVEMGFFNEVTGSVNLTFYDVLDNDYALNIFFDPYGAKESIEISR